MISWISERHWCAIRTWGFQARSMLAFRRVGSCNATLSYPRTLPVRFKKMTDFLLVSFAARCETEAGFVVRVLTAQNNEELQFPSRSIHPG